jgi:hypothetical protein
MLFEDTHASEIVDKLSELVFDVSDSVLDNVVTSCLLEGVHEYSHISSE